MKKPLLLLTHLIFFFQIGWAGGVKLVPMDGHWEFRQLNQGEWLPATVPGTVHTDLLANGLIPDPFAAGSEAQLQWIGEADWEYRLVFDIPRRVFRFDHIDLLLDGIDTYADVFLNDSLILSPHNMFLSWSSSVKSLLRETGNELRLVLYSPIKKAVAQRLLYPYKLPADSDAGEQKTSPFVRKAAYHFGWDWAPRFVTMGICKQAQFRFWDEIRFSNLQVRTVSLDESRAELECIANIKGEGNALGDNELKLLIDGKVVWDTLFHPQNDKADLRFKFTIENPEMWWPRGHGAQRLYEVKGTVGKNGYVLDSSNQRLGLRTVELVREPDDSGTSFYFKVNGKPIFAKGANWVPPAVFLPVAEDKMERLFAAMEAAHFNMLRVWGGGVYGDDALYDWADEQGVLIWQDFMFANAMYPHSRAFHREVAQEATLQIRRLRKHPSLALWCGNNEIEVAWFNWGWQQAMSYSEEDSATLWSGYQALFQKILPDIVDRFDPGRPYISSSPLSNWGKIENFNHHNMHYWGVWHGTDGFEGFRTYVPRFMTEYGFPSFPAEASLAPYAQGASYAPQSDFMQERQKSYKGNEHIVAFMEDWLGTPKTEQDFLLMSQLLQAEGLAQGIRAQRAASPFCMGTLYWQLNDCWPGASWSTVDYEGRWKAAHYRVAELYNSRMIDAEWEGDSLLLHLVDEQAPAKGTIHLYLTDFNGKALWQDERACGNAGMVEHFAWPLKGKLKKLKGKKAVLQIVWEKDGRPSLEAVFHAAKPADMKLPATDVTYTVMEVEEGLLLRLKANAFIKCLEVGLDGSPAEASDNYFDLAPGQERIVFIKGLENRDLAQRLSLKSLVDWRK